MWAAEQLWAVRLRRDAGLLQDGVQGHDEERVLAMLVLTAVHDIMKIAPR